MRTLLLLSLLAATSPDLTKQPTLYVVGYAHLDTQWRWEYPRTIAEFLPKTMHDNFPLFEKYPHYIFNFSGANRYRMMKQYYPADYAIDTNIVSHPVYGLTISNDLRSIPSLMIVSDQNGLWNQTTGIYPNPTSIGVAWERAASLELIRGGDWFKASANAAASVVLCLVAVWVGYVAGAAFNGGKGN